MDYKKIVLGFMVLFGISAAFYQWGGFLNASYAGLGGSTINTSFYNHLNPIGEDLREISDSTYSTDQGTGVSSAASDSAISQARSTFGIVKDVFLFVPNLIKYAAETLHIGSPYSDLAGWAFTFAFMITLAYLLLLGVKNL